MPAIDAQADTATSLIRVASGRDSCTGKGRAVRSLSVARTFRYLVRRCHTAISLCLVVLAGCFVPAGEDRPPFVERLITEFEAGPKKNPPGSIWRYRYGDRVVYYVPPSCCDIPGQLYDSNGEFICAPDGGITGRGDGKCPDFFSVRADELRIWIDDR
jgi:hypothetical protein